MTSRNGILAACAMLGLVLGGNGVEDEGQTQKLAMSRADLVVEGVRLSPARVNNMTNAALTFTVRNRGTATAPSSAAAYYLSSDYQLSDDDRKLGSIGSGDIERGGAAAKRVTLRFPLSIAPGPYFVIVKADDTNRIFETDKANNTASVALTVIPHVRPDLRLEILSVDPSRQARGGTVRFRYRVSNAGEGRVTSYQIRFYYSEDRIITTDDQTYALGIQNLSLEPRSTGREQYDQITIPLTATPGNRYIGGIVDPGDEIPESSETNNGNAFPIYVMSENLPDLTVVSLRVRGLNLRFRTGDEITLSCRAENRGSATAPRCSVNYYLSNNTTYDRSARYLGGSSLSIRGSLPAGSGFDFGPTLRIPVDIRPGKKFLLAIVDQAGDVAEQNESNNEAHFAIEIMAKK